MPIKGMTTDKNAGQPTTLGRLRKGAPKPEKGPGKDLDYFRIEFEPQFEYLLPAFQKLYGPKPRSFDRVYFAARTAAEAMPSWHEEWSKTRLLHRCDGERQVRHWNIQADAYSDVPCPCAAPKCQCKPIARLNLFLPEFSAVTHAWGTLLVVTHSVHDITTLWNTLAETEKMFGSLWGIEFQFGRAMREVTVSYVDSKAREKVTSRQNKSLLYLHLAPSMIQQVALPALSNLDAIGPGNVPALPPGGKELGEAAQAHIDSCEMADYLEDEPETEAIMDGDWYDAALDQPPTEEQAMNRDFEVGPPAERNVLVQSLMVKYQQSDKAIRWLLKERTQEGILRVEMTNDEIFVILAQRAAAKPSAASETPVASDTLADLPDELKAMGIEPLTLHTRSRLLTAEEVRAVVNHPNFSQPNLDGDITKQDSSMLARLFGAAYGDAKAKEIKVARHAATQYLFGVEGCSKLTVGEGIAMWNWLSATYDDSSVRKSPEPHAYANQEIRAILDAVSEDPK